MIAGLALGAGLVGPFASSPVAADAQAYTITVTPAGPLADGQAFTVQVAGPPGMSVTNSGFCDPAMPPATKQDDLTEWCTQTVGNGAPGGTAPADKDGVAELTVRAGIGNATKTAPALGTTHDWKCDATSSCLLSLVITPPQGDATFDTSTVLTYRDDDPTAGCGGPAKDQFRTAAPDRLTEQWVSWTVGACGDQGLPTTATFTNDGAAISQLEAGSVDLAYAGVGPAATGGDATRKVVATPIALNATVLAVAGFTPAPSSVPGASLWHHIGQLKMSEAEAAALLSGNLGLEQSLQDSLVKRNPDLASQRASVGFTAPGALAGAQATTEFASTFFATRQPAGWVYPTSTVKFGVNAGKPLGPFADYNTVFNSLAMLNLSAGKPQLVGDIYKKLAEKPQAVSLVSFYLTDLATARQLGLSPVALGDDAHGFVAPTPESLAAAVPAMPRSTDGLRLPPPSAPTGAYPLTYVEYALTPAEQLLDSDCKPEPAELTAIKRWLGYVTDQGQADDQLATSGMVALPDSLRAEAAASLDEIGSSAPTSGPCGPATPVTTPASTSPATGAPPVSVAPSSVPPVLSAVDSYGPPVLPATSSYEPPVLPSSGTGLPPETGTGKVLAVTPIARATRPSSTHAVPKATPIAATVRIPRLPASQGSPLFLAVLAFPLLVALTSGASWLTTGQPLPPWLARLRPRGRVR